MALPHREWLDSAFTWVRSRIGDTGEPGSPVGAVSSLPDEPEVPSTEPLQVEPGAVIAGLRIDRHLARGGSGALLFVATDLATGTRYAVKAFDLSRMLPGADEVRARFLHECRVAASLRHSDIVHVYRTGEERGLAFLVMELLSGSNLARYTRPDRLLPEPVVLRVGARIAGALAHAHAHGVIHRDIKPANVMFDATRDRVTITDFGIASLVHAEHQRGKALFGSPATMAPEQLTDALVDRRADVYALGVVLFQLLAGRLPYSATTVAQLQESIVHGKAMRLADVRADLPPQLCHLVDRMLEKTRSRRPDNADHVAHALGNLAARLSASTAKSSC